MARRDTYRAELEDVAHGCVAGLDDARQVEVLIGVLDAVEVPGTDVDDFRAVRQVVREHPFELGPVGVASRHDR